MEGILLVDKPAGWTSFDVVNFVRKIVANAEGKKPKNVKVGHCGTLDPFATGLLILLISKNYTRRAGEFSKLDKTYDVTVRLGEVSSTGDPEGELTKISNIKPTKAEIELTLKKLTGEIMQTPPAFSAVKVNGQRAYKLARAGGKVNIEPRKVNIKKLTLVSYRYPEIKLTAEVSSGTYIRSLVSDIGEKLTTGAYTNGLRRTKIGDASVDNALAVKTVTMETILKNVCQLGGVNRSVPL